MDISFTDRLHYLRLIANCNIFFPIENLSQKMLEQLIVRVQYLASGIIVCYVISVNVRIISRYVSSWVVYKNHA